MDTKSNKSVMSKCMNLLIEGKTFLILLILVVVLTIASPYFLTVSNIMNVIRQISASAIISVGFTLVIASGNLDLSVGRMLGLIGVVTALISKIQGVPLVAVILLGLLLGAFCGALNGVIGTKMHIPMFITTVAMQGVFQGANYLFSKSSTINQIPPSYAYIGQKSYGFLPLPVIILAVVVCIGYIILNKTIFGRYILAVGGNKEAAKVSGINSDQVIIAVYTVMGICAAIAAFVVTGRAASAQPDAGSGMELDAIAAVIIGGTTLGGGTGKIFGSLVGCLIIGIISNGLTLLGVNTNWQIVTKGLLIIIAVFLDYEADRLTKKVHKKQNTAG